MEAWLRNKIQERQQLAEAVRERTQQGQRVAASPHQAEHKAVSKTLWDGICAQ